MAKSRAEIVVYLKNGRVFKYGWDIRHGDANIHTAGGRCREHADAIIRTGYRSVPECGGELTHWPPHEIQKVVARCAGITTKYPDTECGT